MSKLKYFTAAARARALLLALAALPLIVAACNNSGAGSGY